MFLDGSTTCANSSTHFNRIWQVNFNFPVVILYFEHFVVSVAILSLPNEMIKEIGTILEHPHTNFRITRFLFIKYFEKANEGKNFHKVAKKTEYKMTY